MADETRQRRKKFLKEEGLSGLISLGVAITFLAVETWAFRIVPEGSMWYGVIASFALTELLLKTRTLWKTLPEREIYDDVNRMHREYPQMKSVIDARLTRNNDDLVREISLLTHGEGEIWKSGDRLQTANDLCDGCRRIKDYASTSTDAPYLPPSETKEFYDRQASKLPAGRTRRLLVYPIDELVVELNATSRYKNVDDFVRLHTDRNFELRFWPHSISELEERLDKLMGASNAPRLVDFGIIDDIIVFGQAMKEEDTTKPSGRGHVIIRRGDISHYIAMFNQLWEQTKTECYPAAQLSTLSWLCGMRNHCVASKTSGYKKGKVFFEDTISHIKNSKNLWALDIAEDMKLWLRQNEYRRFLNATIEASIAHQSDGQYSRIYLLRRGLGTQSDAQMFIRQVIFPQLDAGVEIGIASFDTLVDKNLGVFDCIFDDTGWGFYLLPGDEFIETKLSEPCNLIDPNATINIKNIYQDIRNVVSASGRLMRATADLNEEELVDWLVRTPSSR